MAVVKSVIEVGCESAPGAIGSNSSKRPLAQSQRELPGKMRRLPNSAFRDPGQIRKPNNLYYKGIRFPLSPSFKLSEFRHLLTFRHLRFATCPTFLTLGVEFFFIALQKPTLLIGRLDNPLHSMAGNSREAAGRSENG